MERTVAVLVAIAVVATGCATRSAAKAFRSELVQLRTEVADTRAAHEGTVRDIVRATTDLQMLDARTRDLADRVRDTADEVARLTRRVEAVETAARLTQARVEVLAAPPPAPVSPPPPPTPAVARPAREPRETAARGPERAYAVAIGYFNAREHGQAVLELLDFVARYPQHQLAASAQYWIGEAYYVQRDYRQALLEFQKVLEIGTTKKADALVKIGLCYIHLREPSRARQTWLRVVREYPSADSAKQARTLLRTHATTRR